MPARSIFILLVLACADKTAPKPATEQVTPVGDPNCLQTCIQQNQMRAVSPEQIERDCEAGCTGRNPLEDASPQPEATPDAPQTAPDQQIR